LKQVAELTGGTYYVAESAGELQEVFQNLPTYLITRHETTEISVFFTALGALFAGIAIVLALLWHPLP
jgi:Ca-activated chloride channel family protein